ncbi:VWA domain-containing protein, partial [Dehalococcoidia bacterium]|nr:VWA domain-containing protein [Dehalococcoidia bacterium]
ALETVYLSVITFNRMAKQDVPLTELTEFQMPHFSIRPGTSLGEALRLLMHCMRREVVKTTTEIKGDYRPLVFLLTDGQPTDEWESVAMSISSIRSPKIANIYAIGCGDDVDFDVLHRITDIVLKMESLSPESFARMFVWLTASVQSASVNLETLDSDAPLKILELPPGIMEVAKQATTRLDKTPRQVFLHALCAKTKQPYLMRYALQPETGHYLAIASHILEILEDGDAQYLPPINSCLLMGSPPCPYCESPMWGQCGSCGTDFCVPAELPESMTCPKCNASLTFEESSSFEIKRSEG